MSAVSPSALPATDTTLRGMGLMLAFCVMAPLLDVCAKLATETASVGQITAARFVVQAVLMAPFVWAMGLSFRTNGRAFWLIVARAGCLVLSTFTFVAASAVMPIPDALAIVFVEPFILLILGHYIFGDPIGPRRIAASVVGFCGAMLIIQPSIAVFGWVALYPLACAFAFAFYMLLTRAAAPLVHPVAMQMSTAIYGSVICIALLLAFHGQGVADMALSWPEGITWVWLIGTGFWATASHICMTYALKFASPSSVAPLHYLEIVVAVALSYLIFQDFPTPIKWLGMAIIVASGLYILARERRIAAGQA
jgi:drug/metabolite transporter (DMT)-like permease